MYFHIESLILRYFQNLLDILPDVFVSLMYFQIEFCVLMYFSNLFALSEYFQIFPYNSNALPEFVSFYYQMYYWMCLSLLCISRLSVIFLMQFQSYFLSLSEVFKDMFFCSNVFPKPIWHIFGCLSIILTFVQNFFLLSDVLSDAFFYLMYFHIGFCILMYFYNPFVIPQGHFSSRLLSPMSFHPHCLYHFM